MTMGSLEEHKELKEPREHVQLVVNGTPYTVSRDYPASTTLLEFLRHEGISTGTKACCYEGGCGVCLTAVSVLDPVSGTRRTNSVTSCCLLLYACDGVEVTTIEGLGSTRGGVHPVQEKLAVHDGAQCGYCSPGQVMNMYGLLKNNPKPTMKEVEDAFDTTICRCTGYRPILDAMKSFAVDAPESLKGGVIDIEELDGKMCKKSGQKCNGHCSTNHFQSKCSSGIKGSAHEVSDHVHDVTNQVHDVSNNTHNGSVNGHDVTKDVEDEKEKQNKKDKKDKKDKKEKKDKDKDSEDKKHKDKDSEDKKHKDDKKEKHKEDKENKKNKEDKKEKDGDKDKHKQGAFNSHDNPNSKGGKSNWARPSSLSELCTLIKRQTGKYKLVFGNTGFGVYKELKSSNYNSFIDLRGVKELYTAHMNREDEVTLGANLTITNLIQLFEASTDPHLPYTHSLAKHLKYVASSGVRNQSVGYVVTGFNFQVDKADGLTVKSRPIIVVQGISAQLIHARKTEEFLTNKKLSDPNVLKGALDLLSEEVVPDSGPLLASSQYRKSLVLGHFYKFVLSVCKDKVDKRLTSGGWDIDRPVSSGTQDHGVSDTSRFPAGQPMMKVTARHLTTGEVKFLNDKPVVPSLLHAAVVLSTQGNARIDVIDPSIALKTPGVVKFLQASDIPGENNWRPRSWYGGAVSELFSTGEVLYAGQAIGLIVAESESIAQKAAQDVIVTYKDVKPVILDVMEAIKQKSFFPKLGPYTRGDAATAMASAPHKIKGTTRTGEQYHFHLENQTAVCSPTDVGGMDVSSTSQWIDVTQETVAQVLGMDVSSVSVETERLGGAFGGKIFYNIPVAGMCAVAAKSLMRPVKLHLDLNTNMQFQGCRQGYYYEYEVGFDDGGKLLAVVATGYSEAGCNFFPLDGDEHTQTWVDNAYFSPNWSWTIQPCKLNRHVGTAMRAPGSATTMFAMESILDHVATYLKKDHLEIRKKNLFEKGQVTLSGMVLEQCLIRQMVQQMEANILYTERKKSVEEFNKNNRWRKRGLHVMPNRYAFTYTWLSFNTSVIIYHADGSVVIAHGAIDMGQGIDTKAIQTCAHKLGVPVEKIRVVKKSTTVNANSHFTGGSVCSELICLAVIKSCEKLLERLAPIRAKLKDPTWQELVSTAYGSGVNLTAQYWPEAGDAIPAYNAYSVSCCEVELDVLTGQYQILQVDYLYDCGTSLNPQLDVGQLEGAFNMGCGLFLLEGLTHDPVSGKVLTDGTWNYKPPMPKDLPIVFNIKFLRNSPNPVGVLGSKAVGETPVAQGSCPLFALKRAVEAAREEIGQHGWFPLHAPATVEKLQMACLNDASHYTIFN
ncbi:uncharacterized protein LOC131928419 [Physella acuta]|uniref:uncharacterized protein LOC131928419 n=1 Tax=Physella acuta TaxID=109671 RepID=UPI0027DCE848|nr:uncharacterized protein LOC131928419 [Physella acuta]